MKMASLRYDPETLPRLISYVKERRKALRASRDLADSYSGPDPNPSKRAAEESAIEALDGVLDAVRKLELEAAKRRINNDLGTD